MLKKKKKRSFMLASRFRTKESPSNRKLLYIKLKRRFPFILQVPAMIQNHQQSPQTVILTVDSLSCFSAYFPFFPFCRGVFLCLWQLCLLLCRPSQPSTERSRLRENVSVIGYIDARRSRFPIGLRFQEA